MRTAGYNAHVQGTTLRAKCIVCGRTRVTHYMTHCGLCNRYACFGCTHDCKAVTS